MEELFSRYADSKHATLYSTQFESATFRVRPQIQANLVDFVSN